MVISKRALHRRTVLRGIGSAVALPLLDAMVPAFTSASAAAQPVKRLGVVYLPNGVVVKDLIPPTTGAAFEITPILKPLEPFRNQLTVVSGLANVAGDPIDAGSGPHSRTSGCWLSGVRVRRTENADLRAGRTMDQFAADELGRDTPLRSLELALEPNFTVGGCEGGYSCTYINTFSWIAPDRPLPMETNPAVVFERLFGEGETGNARLARMRRERSILDAVTGSLSRLQRAGWTHGSSHFGRVLRRRTRRRAPRAADGAAGRCQCGRARAAVRDSGHVRRTRPLDVRPDVPGVPRGRHARGHLPARPRVESAIVSRDRRRRSAPRHLTSRASAPTR